MEKFWEYAPIILVIIMFCVNYKIFVNPVDLEKKHREILNDIDNKYASKTTVDELRYQIHDMADKVDKIYNIVTLKDNK